MSTRSRLLELLVESAGGAVPMLPSVRFPRPLAEPAVRVSRQQVPTCNQ
jgi:hypothetical protein